MVCRGLGVSGKRNAHRGPAGNRKCHRAPAGGRLAVGGGGNTIPQGTPSTRRAGLGAGALTGGALSCVWNVCPCWGGRGAGSRAAVATLVLALTNCSWRSGLTSEISVCLDFLFDKSEVGKQEGLSCPWVRLSFG